MLNLGQHSHSALLQAVSERRPLCDREAVTVGCWQVRQNDFWTHPFVENGGRTILHVTFIWQMLLSTSIFHPGTTLPSELLTLILIEMSRSRRWRSSDDLNTSIQRASWPGVKKKIQWKLCFLCVPSCRTTKKAILPQIRKGAADFARALGSLPETSQFTGGTCEKKLYCTRLVWNGDEEQRMLFEVNTALFYTVMQILGGLKARAKNL